MKTLVIITVILVVLFLYFFVNADRSIFVKGSEVLPTGTDVARFILNKAKDLNSQINAGRAPYPVITDKIKSAVEKIKDEANKLIPKAIDKTIETFCPAK